MDFKSRYLRDPLDTSAAFSYAEYLLQKGDFRSLESFFRSTLPNTLNLDIWSLYLKYIRSQSPASILPAYSYMISIMWFHYDIYDYMVEYIKLLDQDIDKIREVYILALSNPIHNLSSLFQQYESWELSLSKVTYKSLVNERLPSYQDCFKLYQKLLPFISNLEFDNIFKILDLETQSRKIVLVKYFKEKFYYKEEVYFLYNELLLDKEILKEGIKTTNSMFLKIYFAMCYDDTDVLDMNSELETICYLNILGKRSIESFHTALDSLGIHGVEETTGMGHGDDPDISKPIGETQAGDNSENNVCSEDDPNIIKVVDMADSRTSGEVTAYSHQNIYSSASGNAISPYVLIYAAKTEYSLTSNPNSAFKIFYQGVNKSSVLNEAFLKFLIDINDVSNAKALFKILDKTEKMWDWIIDFEFKYGSFPEYKRLVTERMESKGSVEQGTKKELAKNDSVAVGYKLLYGLFLKSLGFMDLVLARDEWMTDFIKEVPRLNDDNVFQSIKSSEVISLLRTVDFVE